MLRFWFSSRLNRQPLAVPATRLARHFLQVCRLWKRPHHPRGNSSPHQNQQLDWDPRPSHQLTQLTLLFPACSCQMSQFSILLGQLELSVAEVRLVAEAVLSQASVGHQQHRPFCLDFLKLHTGQKKQASPFFSQVCFPNFHQENSDWP